MKADSIKSELSITQFTITPDRARYMLQVNTPVNRKINRARVAYYAKQMRDGRWHESPQGLVFDTKGILIDGQHRLAAVVESETPVKMTVITNAPSESFKVLDSGMPRSLAQRAGINKNVVSVCAQIKSLIDPSLVAASGMAIEDLEEVYSVFGEHVERVAMGSKRKYITVAPIYAAVVLHLAQGDEYAFEQFMAMVNVDVTKMTPMTATLFKLLNNKSIGGSALERREMVVRAYKALSEENKSMSRIVINDFESYFHSLKKLVQRLMKDM